MNYERSYDRPTQLDKKNGVSVVCAVPRIRAFSTGGYDHIVHLWSQPTGEKLTPTPLPIKHTSVIQTLLLLHDTSNTLLSGSADCSISVYDLASERVVNTLKLSNPVYQLHQAPSPSCTLVEVHVTCDLLICTPHVSPQIGHREYQFEVRDYRVAPTAESTIRFGYPNAKVHGRFVRGKFPIMLTCVSKCLLTSPTQEMSKTTSSRAAEVIKMASFVCGTYAILLELNER